MINMIIISCTKVLQVERKNKYICILLKHPCSIHLSVLGRPGSLCRLFPGIPSSHHLHHPQPRSPRSRHFVRRPERQISIHRISLPRARHVQHARPRPAVRQVQTGLAQPLRHIIKHRHGAVAMPRISHARIILPAENHLPRLTAHRCTRCPHQRSRRELEMLIIYLQMWIFTLHPVPQHLTCRRIVSRHIDRLRRKSQTQIRHHSAQNHRHRLNLLPLVHLSFRPRIMHILRHGPQIVNPLPIRTDHIAHFA